MNESHDTPVETPAEEAGGIFTDLDGQAPNLDTGSVLAATPGLYAALSAELNPA